MAFQGHYVGYLLAYRLPLRIDAISGQSQEYGRTSELLFFSLTHAYSTVYPTRSEYTKILDSTWEIWFLDSRRMEHRQQMKN